MDILDSDEIPQSNTALIQRKVIEFIPLVIIILSFLQASFKYLTSEFIFPTLNIIGFSSAGLLIIIFFIHRKTYKFLLGLLLIAGTFNLVGFNIKVFSLQLSFGVLSFSVQLFSLGLLVLYFIIFRNGIIKYWGLFHDFLREDELTIEQKKASKISSIQFYKNNLSGKSIDSLLLISEDKSRVPEARLAAEELISEQQLKS